MEASRDRFQEEGFAVAERKLELPPREITEICIEAWNNCVMLPNHEKMMGLLSETRKMIQVPKWAEHWLSEVLGN